MKHGGDDLEDDFVPDDIVALSGDEPVGAQLYDEDIFIDDEGQTPEEEDDTDEAQVGLGAHTFSSTDLQSSASAKKRKRREKEKERKKRKLVEALEIVEISVAEQPPDELMEYISAIQTMAFPKLSSIELDDIRIPASSIVDTSLWTGPRTLDHLVEFILKMLPNLRIRLLQRSKSNGAPTLIYVAAAALRVADVTRIFKDKRLRSDKSGEVAKLFAKHFKLSQHIEYLKRTKVAVAVGTPGRLGKLLNETGANALNVSAVSHIILDITHKDAKTRNLLEIPETRRETFETVLGNSKILKGIKEGRIEVVLF